MATVYECDVTGKQYDEAEALAEVGLFDESGRWAAVEFGPDATLDEVLDRLHVMVDEMRPFHPDWYDVQSDTYMPPRLCTRTVVGETYRIKIHTVHNPQ